MPAYGPHAVRHESHRIMLLMERGDCRSCMDSSVLSMRVYFK